MNQTFRTDLKIAGAGSANGGRYDSVRIDGKGTVNGDVECREFKINGAADIHGDLKAQSMQVNGSCTFGGNIAAGQVKINGSSEIGGQLSAEEAEIRGSLNLKGDCEAEYFSSSGGFKIQGMLNAGTIQISLHGPCKVKEIGGEKITVGLGSGSRFGKIIKSLFNSSDKLVTDLIEGDEITLENTVARVVRGKRVTIGKGCDIELVEYQEQFQQNEESTVRENKQV